MDFCSVGVLLLCRQEETPANTQRKAVAHKGQRYGNVNMRHFLSEFYLFLTSRPGAICLLIVSACLLIIKETFALYHPVFLIIPIILFFSVSICIIRRFRVTKRGYDYKFWGSIVFHIGMLVLIVAVFMGSFTRFGATVVLPLGMTVSLLDKDFVGMDSSSFVGEIPFVQLRLNSMKMRYEKGIHPVDYTADVSISIGGTNMNEVIRINRPVHHYGYQFMYYEGNNALLLILRDSSGKKLFSQYLRVSDNPVNEKITEILPAGITLYTRFFADMFMDGEKYGSRSRELKNPAMGIKITTKTDPFKNIWSGILKVGEKAEFEGYTFEFAELKPVITMKIVKDISYWGIFTGWLLFIIGLFIRYLSFWKKIFRKEADKEAVGVS